MKPYDHTKTYTRNVILVLFVNIKKWKQPKCPLMGEWMVQLWYVHTTDYYSATERTMDTHNNLIGLKRVMLSEKVNLKGSHTAWFHYTAFLKWQNCRHGVVVVTQIYVIKLHWPGAACTHVHVKLGKSEEVLWIVPMFIFWF